MTFQLYPILKVAERNLPGRQNSRPKFEVRPDLVHPLVISGKKSVLNVMAGSIQNVPCDSVRPCTRFDYNSVSHQHQGWAEPQR
jgi:hypothetical protein